MRTKFLLRIASIVVSVAVLAPAGRVEAAAARPGAVQQPDNPVITVSAPVTPTASPAARDLPVVAQAAAASRVVERRPHVTHRANGPDRTPAQPQLDPLLAQQAGVFAAPDTGIITPTFNFAGHGATGVAPPDAVGEIGPQHYIQMVNNVDSAFFTIFDKATGAIVAGPALLSGLGVGDCASGFGDPIVLYDQTADRWLMSEIAGTGLALCVYISKGADPTGDYWAYEFSTDPEFPDFPKYAVWPTGYFVTANESQPAVYALERAKMLAGQAATLQRVTAPLLSGFQFQALTPADLDGFPPPAGAPALFARHRDTEVHGPAGMPNNDLLEMWSFAVNWANPAASQFTKLPDIAIAEIDSDLCGLDAFECFPQPAPGAKLDPLREVIMWRLQYRNFGAYQTLVGNLVTDVDGADHGGVRWFELRNTGAGWTLHQEGTYAPDAADRWMGSIAMDRSGNILLGYNVVSPAIYASLRYNGRLADDPLGVLTQGEHKLATGTTAGMTTRYGDYNSMNVDPVDGCTFWFTGEYDSSDAWRTRIAALRYAACNSEPKFGLAIEPADQDQCVELQSQVSYTVTVPADYDFAGDVQLAVAGTSGAAGFAENPLAPNGVTTLVVTGAQPGPNTYTVTATSLVTPSLITTSTLSLGVYISNVVTVTSTADAGSGSLRAAIDAVCSGGTVRFADSLIGATIGLQSGELRLGRKQTIAGPGAGAVAITGGTSQRVFSIAQNSQATIADLTISATDLRGLALDGAAIENAGVLNVQRVQFIDNGAQNGGAIANLGVLTLTQSALLSNTASSNGGALANLGGEVHLVNSTLARNRAANGAGIYNLGLMAADFSTVSGNQAAQMGGGIANMAAGLTASASSAMRAGTATAAVTLTGMVVGANVASGGVDLAGSFVGSDNVVANGEGSAGLADGVNGNRIGTAAAPVDVLLAVLAAYNSSTFVQPLLPGSPALNASGTTCPAVDQRGQTRPQFAACDAGAFESQGFTLTVTSGSGQTATVESPFAAPLAVQVGSVDGTPVDGGQLRYRAPVAGAGARLSPSATPTIASGAAVVTATANSLAGGYSVTATTPSAVQAAAFELRNIGGYFVPWVAVP